MSEYVFQTSDLTLMFPEYAEHINASDDEGAVSSENLQITADYFPDTAPQLFKSIEAFIENVPVEEEESEMQSELRVVEQMMQVFRQENAEIKSLLPELCSIPDNEHPDSFEFKPYIKWLREERMTNLKWPYDSFFKLTTAATASFLYNLSRVTEENVDKASWLYAVPDETGHYGFVLAHDFLNPNRSKRYGLSQDPSENFKMVTQLADVSKSGEDMKQLVTFLHGAKNWSEEGNIGRIGQKKIHKAKEIIDNAGMIVDFEDIRKVFLETKLVPQFHLETIRFFDALFQHIKYSKHPGADFQNEINSARATMVNHFINLNQTYLQPEAEVSKLFQFVFQDCGFGPLMNQLKLKDDARSWVNGIRGEIDAYFMIKKRNPDARIISGGDMDRVGADLVVLETDTENNQRPTELVQIKNDAALKHRAEFHITDVPLELMSAVNGNGRLLTETETNQMEARYSTITDTSSLSACEQIIHGFYMKKNASQSRYTYSRLRDDLNTLVKLLFEARSRGCKATWIVTNANNRF